MAPKSYTAVTREPLNIVLPSSWIYPLSPRHLQSFQTKKPDPALRSSKRATHGWIGQTKTMMAIYEYKYLYKSVTQPLT